VVIAIDDPADPRLADYRDLNDLDLRRRREEARGVFVVEGRVAVRQLLRAGWTVGSLLVDEHQAAAVPDLLEAVEARHAPVYVAPRPVVAATVGFDLHRGVVAAAPRPAPTDPDALVEVARGQVLLVLEGVNDHENIGALFRNAAAFGVAAVLLDPTTADPLYRRSVRVSAGHVLSVPFARVAPWPAGLARLRAAGFLVAALAPDRASFPQKPLPQQVAQLRQDGKGVALVVGAEGPGLSAAALAAADAVVSIPMAPGVDSLNVATAAAVVLSHLVIPSVGCSQ